MVFPKLTIALGTKNSEPISSSLLLLNKNKDLVDFKFHFSESQKQSERQGAKRHREKK